MFFFCFYFPTLTPYFNCEVAYTVEKVLGIFCRENQPALVPRREAEALAGARPLWKMHSKYLLSVCCPCLSASVLFPAATKTLKPFFFSCPSPKCLSESPRQCNEQDLCF